MIWNNGGYEELAGGDPKPQIYYSDDGSSWLPADAESNITLSGPQPDGLYKKTYTVTDGTEKRPVGREYMALFSATTPGYTISDTQLILSPEAENTATYVVDESM
ncbi:MAG: hypothetical protein ACOX68_06235, partial [Candidatus Limivicinus sp.]